ncbi:uncharacterized protein [Nicotiana tomentosiformis]|uniref:uncharacterized protein n=1 Tax=Nicotiana tomentosiformis TaxID=4098 RepID=UPI00388CAD17
MYEFLGPSSTLAVIISACLTNVQVDSTLAVLQKRIKTIGWTLADIRGISPSFCMHKIILEDDAKPSMEYQRRLNEAMQEVIKKEIVKWLDVGVVYPISDSSWTSPVQCVPKKGMLFGLCNAPATFQRCMMAIFMDMVKDVLEVFMDDFSVVGDSFEEFLDNFDKVLAHCEETNLVLNWEKCYFMVEEGIVLGHKISKDGIEVDKAKIEVISKLPPPTFVKGVRSFLGRAGFYQRFIKDFSKVVNPLCKLLEKDAKKGSDNQVADHLSRLEEEGRPHNGLKINDSFPNEQLLSVSLNGMLWFADVANFLVTGIIPSELSFNQRKKLKRDNLDYYWDEPFFIKICNDGVIRRCVPEE